MTGCRSVAAVLACALLAGGTAGSLSAAAAAALEVGSAPLQVWELAVQDVAVSPPEPVGVVDDVAATAPSAAPEAVAPAPQDPGAPAPAAIAPDPFEVVVGGAPAPAVEPAPEPQPAEPEAEPQPEPEPPTAAPEP